MWQEFYARHKDRGIEVVTVAMDAQGAEKARPYVEEAGAAYTTLVDEDNLLSRLLSFKAVPNALLIDEAGLLNYQKYGGFDIRKQEYAEIAEGWAQGASPQWLAERMQEDARGGPDHEKATEHFQRGADLYKEGDTAGRSVGVEAGAETLSRTTGSFASRSGPWSTRSGSTKARWITAGSGNRSSRASSAPFLIAYRCV